jgi:hypothetical protein
MRSRRFDISSRSPQLSSMWLMRAPHAKKISVTVALHLLCTITVHDTRRSTERNANEEIELNQEGIDEGIDTSRQAHSSRLDDGGATDEIAESVAGDGGRAARRGTDPLPRL